MKRIKNCLIALVILALTVAGWQLRNDVTDLQYRIFQPRPSIVAMTSRVINSAVYIETEWWSGSGVIVAPHVILTAGHVVEDANDLKIMTADGEWHTAEMWILHPDTDLGMIFFDDEFGSIAEFTDSVIIGEQIIAIGSPYSETFFNTVTTGIISGVDRHIPFFGDMPVITSDVEGNPGNSGGPIFNMQGKLIGVLVGTYSWYGNGVVIVPGNICQELLK